MITKQKLDRLAELKAEQDLLNIKKQELIDSVLTPEIRTKIAEIEEEFEPQFGAVNDKSSAIESEIKAEVIGLGESVKGTVLQCCFVKGRVSWDTKGLDGYLVDHPELNRFRKQGDPSASIRKA